MAEQEDPRAKAVADMMQRFGGREAFFKRIDKRYEEFTRVWNQDAERIGRILRAHLAVEHLMADYLAATNPKLGDIGKARLTYAQKVELLNADESGLVGMLLPGLRRLGAIRNRIAHRLQVELTEDDERLFLSIELFKAMRNEKRRRWFEHPEVKASADDARLAIVEDFAQFASGQLHAGADPDKEIWVEAMKAFAPSATSTAQ